MNQATERERLKTWIDHADENLLKALSDTVDRYHNQPSTVVKANSIMLCRLVYTSVRAKTCDDHEIDKILEVSQRNNERLGITGILIATSNRFLQVLEGTKDKLMPLYEKIKQDDRHAGSVMRYFHPTRERYFGNWHMGIKKFFSREIAYKSPMSAEHQKLYDAIIEGDEKSYQDQGMEFIRRFLLVD